MPTLEELVSHPPQLPVTRALGDIAAATRPGGCAVITAPPGTGKTTLLPPAVAVALAQYDASAGRVLVTQPRRVAARAAARRIARLLSEEVGGQVGYSVRGDSRVSERTRVEMVTPGVALRRLQRDPELPGVSALIVDEFHERDLDTDLALAFALDARSALRDDLFVALTSATLEASRTVDFLRVSTGEEPALVDIPGDIFPLELRYAPPPRGVEAVGAIGNERVGVRREYLAHVARTVEETVAATKGSVLVFLPGVGEIETVRGNLHLGGIPVLTLHGQLSAAEQDRALSPASGRRVILSTSIAESSLTVPGVSVVVDAGLAREPRFDAGRSLSSLVTVPAALAHLEQRAGRAARTGPGIAVRVMDSVDVARRPALSAPGIATQDLTDARLQVASWGTRWRNSPYWTLHPRARGRQLGSVCPPWAPSTRPGPPPLSAAHWRRCRWTRPWAGPSSHQARSWERRRRRALWPSCRRTSAFRGLTWVRSSVGWVAVAPAMRESGKRRRRG